MWGTYWKSQIEILMFNVYGFSNFETLGQTQSTDFFLSSINSYTIRRVKSLWMKGIHIYSSICPGTGENLHPVVNEGKLDPILQFPFNNTRFLFCS